MAALKVLKRDRFSRRIDVECPHCQAAVPLSPGHLQELEAGVRITAWCPGCLQDVAVTLAAIGGSLWTPPDTPK